MRRRRRSAKTRYRLLLAGLALAGALLGGLLGGLVGGRMATPEVLDPQRWRTISPALDETLRNPMLGRGSHVVDGALVIREHAFHAADVLVPQLTEAPARVLVTVLPSAAPAAVVLQTRGPGPKEVVELSPTHFGTISGFAPWQERADAGAYELRSMGEGIVLMQPDGPVSLALGALAGVELTTLGGEPRIGSILIENDAGEVIFAEDYTASTRAPGPVLLGLALGALWGLALAVALAGGGALWPVLAAALPLLVLGLDDSAWLGLVERLYLSRTPYWHLARAVLALAMVPLLATALLRSGLLQARDRRTHHLLAPRSLWMLWAAAAVASGLLASRSLSGLGLLAGLLGTLGLLGAPALARQLRLSPAPALLVALPGLLALAALGWRRGLLLMLCWELLLVVARVKLLLHRSPRHGANLLLTLLIGTPISLELAVRATYLERGWHTDTLRGEKPSESDWREAAPFWSDSCGPEDAAQTVRIAWAGGSSTGGAYQFRRDPTAFFPSQTHARLCAALPAGTRLVTRNHGDGGRDSFTISRSIGALLGAPPPELLVVYLGVNDVMTDSGGLTRKQREQRLRELAAHPLRALTGRSRVLTGIGLVLRPPRAPTAEGAPMVPEVPLEDADENLRLIAAATAERATQVLLLTELLRDDFGGSLDDYDRMLRAVASDFPHVHYLDLRAQLGPGDRSGLMADRNHLSREGAALVGRLLAPEVARLAGLRGPINSRERD